MAKDYKSAGISSAALRYLKMLDEKEKALEKAAADTFDMSFYNRLMRFDDDLPDITMMIPEDQFESTGILIQDSDMLYKPQTDQMSFMSKMDNENSEFMSVASNVGNTNIFDGSSTSSAIFGKSPPLKRFCSNQPANFFNLPSPEQSMTVDEFFREEAENTEDLFADKATSFCPSNIINFSKAFNKEMADMRFQLSSTRSSSVFSEAKSSSESPDEATYGSQFRSCKSDEMSAKKAETSRKKTVNTFYQVPHVLNAKKIEDYYKNRNFTDWEANIDNLMEPSVDYVSYRMKCLKPITIGSKNAVIDLKKVDSYNCDTINESIEEIESSFDNGKFICSTPEEQEQSAVKTNLPDVAFLNMVSEAINKSKSRQQEEEIEDEDRTRSIIMNKESQNTPWSAITHVSCSLPADGQGDVEGLYDITTVFDYDCPSIAENEEDSTNIEGEDVTRYELLLSILNENDYLLERSSADLQETIKIVQNRKAALMGQIEMIIEALVSCLVNQQPMVLKFHKIKDWKDCKFEDNILSQRETAIAIKSLSFTNKNTKRTFTIIVHLLGEIYKLLCQNTTCTKRELYYRDVELMRNQTAVNRAMDEICALLNVQCWELGVLSTSKGLIAGDLRITTEDDEIIDYSTTNAVPQKPSGIKSMESNAEYVLVVEKDTVFTRLMQDKILEKMKAKIILVTAKGYPDINTRLLLKKIETLLCKPIYIIVDADPYGIDIMCTYKFGSLQMVQFSEQLAITSMEWIGIHPTDIEKLDITRTELTDADRKKVDELIARPYMNRHLAAELNHFKSRGLKAEIESIYHFSIDYLIHDYIPHKISSIANPMQKIIDDVESCDKSLFQV